MSDKEKKEEADDALHKREAECADSVDNRVTEQVREQWAALQDKLRCEVIMEDTRDWGLALKNIQLVAGMDISYPVDESVLPVACVVILSFPELELRCKVTKSVDLKEPYVPGFLAFRESQPLLELLDELLLENPNLKPDVILVDGNGILHPRRYGCACHIGVKSDISTIGVAKNMYKMDGIDFDKASTTMEHVGDSVQISDKSGQVLGLAVKTAENAKNPMYVSVGHKVSLKTAMQIILRCSKFRVPEPTRYADFYSREVLRETQIRGKSSKSN